jgi:hypothetical protein
MPFTPALSPAFAEAASRRQASRERENWIESMSIFGRIVLL